jgi:hypothetical protein
VSVLASTRRVARRVGRSPGLKAATRAGLLGYGVLHAAVAWLTVQIALGRPTTEGDQSGAFRVLAAAPVGRFLVSLVGVGLVAMAVWQLLEALVGNDDERGARRTLDRIVSASRTVIYLALAWTAFQVVRGAPTSNAAQQSKATGGALAAPGGPWLVGAAGVAVALIGLAIAGYGITKGFERRLRRSQMSRRARRLAVATGQLGYAVKGLAYAVVGGLLVAAAVTFDPSRSTGLDGALRTLAGQPGGRVLLYLVAAGFAIYGVYCLFQFRYRKV